ncbi:MAG: glutathione S-transferase, partial [Phenylobacterium sp.]|nr:glutathione S-transferase [Phenylobacterium sp.]
MSLDLTLHHFPLDPASRQVRLALGEKRLPFAEEQVRYWERPASLVKMNPSGMTPVLTVGTRERLILCESRAILDYLEETHPDTPLLGRDPAERAEARRLLQWFDRKFDYEVGGFILHEKMEKRILGLGAPDLASLRQGREALRVHLTYVESLLASRDWLVGRRLSLADFA